MTPSDPSNPSAAEGRPTILQLVVPFWKSHERWKAFAKLAVIVVLMFGITRLMIWSNKLAGQVVDALVARDWDGVLAALAISVGVGLGVSFLAISRAVITNLLDLQWRSWMTARYLDRWTRHNIFFDVEREGTLSNPDQRISEDIKLFTNQTLGLWLGFLSAAVMIGSYGYSLWHLSGALDFTLFGRDFSIPGYMVYVAIAYSIGQLWVMHWIGKLLIGLNNRRQTVEADFRYRAVQLRENAEQIAFYGGGDRERSRLSALFERIRHTVRSIYFREGKVMFVQEAYARFFDPVATIASLPRYFSGEISLGGMTEITGTFTMFSGALSVVNQSYIGVTQWLGISNRLRDLSWRLAQAENLNRGIVVRAAPQDAIDTGPISLRTPVGQPMTEVPAQRFAAGERWLISGPSGTGKSSFLRAIAGLWPYGAGTVTLPQGAPVLFLPQRSYIPEGDLKSALAYPSDKDAFLDAEVHAAIALVGLSEALPDIGVSAAWQQTLSGGEQQRLAVARALLHRPAFLFMDEATSALDKQAEKTVYEALFASLPDSAIISVAHRSALGDYHDNFLELSPASRLRTSRGAIADLKLS